MAKPDPLAAAAAAEQRLTDLIRQANSATSALSAETRALRAAKQEAAEMLTALNEFFETECKPQIIAACDDGVEKMRDHIAIQATESTAGLMLRVSEIITRMMQQISDQLGVQLNVTMPVIAKVEVPLKRGDGQ